jgi:ATP-dependent Clp protease ATP-binding subunit ClpA
MENYHADKGGAAGARARKRTCDDLLNKWNRGAENYFVLEGTEFRLAPAFRRVLALVPRSDRQRLWAVTTEKAACFKRIYTGNDEVSDCVLNVLRIEGRKVKPRSPVGVFLLAGPTGTGKTFLGQTVAKAFNKGTPIRIDCTQFDTEESVTAALFGAPVGYKGAERGGILTKEILIRRDRVVILDEIDRAHPSFFDAIMNAIDEGSALDRGSNLPVDLRQCLFLMTTDLAADTLEREMAKFNGHSIMRKAAAAREIIRRTNVLAPEQLARIHWVLSLTRRNGGIADGEDVRMAIRSVLEEFGLEHVTVDADVEQQLVAACAASGYSDIRNLRRIIQSRMGGALLDNRTGDYEILDGTLCERAPF